MHMARPEIPTMYSLSEPTRFAAFVIRELPTE